MTKNERAVQDAFARTMFVTAYADHVQDGEYNDGNGGPCKGCELFGHEDGHPQPGPSEDWESYAPETPVAARRAAAGLLRKLVTANRVSRLADLLQLAGEADHLWEFPSRAGKAYPEGYAEEFGSDLAMMALGHGVSWFDDHLEFELDVPHLEYVIW
jgi:hypothetical protein